MRLCRFSFFCSLQCHDFSPPVLLYYPSYTRGKSFIHEKKQRVCRIPAFLPIYRVYVIFMALSLAVKILLKPSATATCVFGRKEVCVAVLVFTFPLFTPAVRTPTAFTICPFLSGIRHPPVPTSFYYP